MLGKKRRARKKTKSENPLPKILNGAVASQMVKCGKRGCKCERGELHGKYYYRVGWIDGKRFKEYIRLKDVEAVKEACENYRVMQAEIRAGRISYKHFLKQVKSILG